MSFSKLSHFLALFILFFLFFQTPSFAAKLSYIVYMGVHSHGLEDAEATVSKVKDSHCQFLASFLGSSEKAKEAIFYSYSQDINGFATTLEDEKAAAIANDLALTMAREELCSAGADGDWLQRAVDPLMRRLREGVGYGVGQQHRRGLQQRLGVAIGCEQFGCEQEEDLVGTDQWVMFCVSSGVLPQVVALEFSAGELPQVVVMEYSRPVWFCLFSSSGVGFGRWELQQLGVAWAAATEWL
ncbi:hypothetical protein TEA_001805 [Camellia sinensis var. sinensis]|uniref:Inhibitor I9 domain-containing protein n=1 Tax=Camellia sinensis var. sinensis TaxID=542762 RepID=A0A4S4ED71_CAMSN|nr:hypothetical protein TEA_001805 [Camellia sinensis var. sinensis]